jgi:hypothetical protein
MKRLVSSMLGYSILLLVISMAMALGIYELWLKE